MGFENATAPAWILVADAGQARVFATGDGLPGIAELADFKEEGRLHPDLVGFSDRPARVQESVGPRQHAVEPKTDPKRLRAERFARELADFLSESLDRGRYRHLVVLAPPRFAALLRRAMAPGTQATVAHWLVKDMVHLSPAQVLDRVRAQVRPSILR